MKKLEILLRPKAREDITEIGAYIGLDNPEASAAFRQTLQNLYEVLADLPEIGSFRNFDNPELEGLRMLPVPKFKKYLIFYRPTSEKVEIVRVLHRARDIPTLFGEAAVENGQEQRAA
jgi:toxin ParE1/3/4